MAHEDMTYLATRFECGHAIGAVVDSPTHRGDTAKEVARWVRRGFIVTRVTTQVARDAEWCMCLRKGMASNSKQMVLPEA